MRAQKFIFGFLKDDKLSTIQLDLKILGIKLSDPELDFIFRVVLFFCSSNFVIEIWLYGGPQKCKLEVEEMRTFFLLT